MSMGIMAFADESSSHVITITNTDQNVPHTYAAYQVFKGKLDASQTKLADIVWGNGVNGDNLLAALKASTVDAALKATSQQIITPEQPASGTEGQPDYVPAVPAVTIEVGESLFKYCTSAADVANVLSKFQSTGSYNADGTANTGFETMSAGAIDAFASLVAANLGTKAADFAVDSTDTTGTTYKATVTGDGYYFVKDTTTTLTGEDGSDTLSKYLLAVVKNTTVVAKDTHLSPDKEIVEGSATVKEGTAAVGDTVTFKVTIQVPNTKKYVDHFVFDMKDTLPEGLTFMGITSVKVGEQNVPYTATVLSTDEDGNAVKDEHGKDVYAAYTAPTSAAAAVTTAGGQQIKVVFNNFKANAEAANPTWIGQNLVVTYTAVVNEKANFTSTGNENEVYFDYSNDPNHDYDGDEPDDDEPMGETPHDKTKTKLINIEIQKTGDGGTVTALAGAEFEITSSDYNVTLVTGEKFEEAPYTAPADSGETVLSGTYYKLKDGSYTTTAPTDNTASSYASTTQTYNKVTFSKSVTTPSGETKKVTVITDESGKIKLEGLKPGTYTIKETKAPSGYNLDKNTYTIKINWTYDADTKTGTFSKDASSSEGVTFTDSTATASITIDNNSGATLPSTGGIGTTIFYVVGSILVVAAGVLLITKKRMSREG